MPSLHAMTLATGALTLAEIGGGIIVFAGVLTALGVIGRKFWRFVAGVVRVYRLSHQAFETIVGTDDTPGINDRLGSIEKELHPNGGSSMRDDVQTGVREARAASADARRAVAEAERVGHITEDLRGYAEANRNGITDLRQGQAAVDQRITDHRRRNDEQIAEIRKFLHDKYGDAVEAAEHLRASVTELLLIREEPVPHTRSTDPETPDHVPDL